MPLKEISVIIPVYNEEKDVQERLKSLYKQSLQPYEIIVIDDGSSDNTLEAVKKFKKVKLIKGAHKGPGFSRNLGAKQAKGNVLIFIDADMTFDKDYLKNLVLLLKKDKSIIGTTHELEIVNNTSNIWSRCWGRIRVSKEESHDVKIFRAVRRAKFLSLGGFDPKYGYADDQTFWFRYKIKPTVAEKTICYHKNPESLKNVFKQSRWIGASIENKLLSTPFIKYLCPLMLIIASPLAIPLLSIKKSYKLHDFKILFPWMFLFITARFFGTIAGISRKLYLDRNTR